MDVLIVRWLRIANPKPKQLRVPLSQSHHEHHSEKIIATNNFCPSQHDSLKGIADNEIAQNQWS